MMPSTLDPPRGHPFTLRGLCRLSVVDTLPSISEEFVLHDILLDTRRTMFDEMQAVLYDFFDSFLRRKWLGDRTGTS